MTVMKRRLTALLGLTLILAAAATVTAYAFAGNGAGTSEPNNSGSPATSAGCSEEAPACNDTPVDVDGEGTIEPDFGDWSGPGPVREPDPGNGPVATSIDDIDPDVCNAIHNLNACTPEELDEFDELGITIHGDPTYEQWLANYALSEDASASTLVTTQDESGEIEPWFVDGEPKYQSVNDPFPDCGLAGGTAYVTSDGKVGCIPLAHYAEESGEEQVSSSQPPAIEPTPAPATK